MNDVLTRDQVRRADDLAINKYKIAGVVLMENAGLRAAEVIDRSYGPSGQAFICCGPGNNGGDGCVIARHLYNAGWSVRLLVTGREEVMSPDMRANYRIVKAMGLEATVADDGASQQDCIASIRKDEVIIDALLGTGFRGQVRSPAAELITGLNDRAKRAVVAVDVPSGLDCDTGESSKATIRADLTVTFVAMKIGFTKPQAASCVGRVEVCGIGAPRELVSEIVRTDS